MARALSLVLVLLVAVGAPAAAQTRYKTPGNRFWVDLPNDWRVEEREQNRWLITGGRDGPETRCVIEFRETMDTLWTPQDRLNEMITADEFVRRARAAMARGVGAVPVVATGEIGGVRFLRMQATGRENVNEQPAVLIAAWALVPGQSWRLNCGVPLPDADRTLPHLQQMLTSFTIINPDGATNAR